MEPDEVCVLMRSYFQESQPADVLERFPELSPRDLLKESLDVVDFVVYLEEGLEREIDLNQLGEALLKKNFGDLSTEVARMLSEG